MQQLNNESYLQQIASVGDREKIIAANDIYSVAGIKLLARAVRLILEYIKKFYRTSSRNPLMNH